MGFQVIDEPLPGLKVIQPDVFKDDRGFFMELYNEGHFSGLNLENTAFLQDNLSQSTKGTLRGLHFQAPPHAQGKLVSVIQGAVLDVVVDIRLGSPTYGQVFQQELTSESRQMIYVPTGFAHGFQVLSDTCLFLYKCTALYNKPSEGGIAWNDPALHIKWADIPPVLSAKDQAYPSFENFVSPFEIKAAV